MKSNFKISTSLIKYFGISFCIFSLLSIMLMVSLYHINIPYSDDYDTFALDLIRFSGFQYVGSIFNALNGHEIVTLKTFAALNYYFFSGDIKYITILFYLLNMAFLLFINNSLKHSLHSKDSTYYSLPILSALILSSFSFSISLMLAGLEYIFTSLFFAAAVLVFIFNLQQKSRVFLVSLFSVIASLSSLNGIFVFPACFILLIIFRSGTKNILIYFFIGLLVALLYYLHSDSVRSQMDILSAHIALYTRFKMFFMFLADFTHLTVFEPYANAVSFIIGLISFIAWLLLAIYFVMKDKSDNKKIYCWILIALLPISSALLLSLFRTQYGEGQAFADRYEIYVILFWISLWVLLLTYLKQTENKLGVFLARIYVVIIYIMIIVCAVVSFITYKDPYLMPRLMALSLSENTYIANTAINVYTPKNLSKNGQIYGASTEEREFLVWMYFEKNRLSFASTNYFDTKVSVPLLNRFENFDFSINNFDERKDNYPGCNYGFQLAHLISGSLVLKDVHFKYFSGFSLRLLFVDESNKIVGQALFDTPISVWLSQNLINSNFNRLWLGYIRNFTENNVKQNERIIKVYVYDGGYKYFIKNIKIPIITGCN